VTWQCALQAVAGLGPRRPRRAEKSWFIAALVAILMVAARAEPQSVPAALDQALIRVQSQGNELFAMREAPVAYSTLEQIATSIGGSAPPRTAAPVRVVRASPPQEIDYLFCITNGGTLVLGERVHTRAAAERPYVFARGAIVRSYPSLSVPEGWLWLVDVPLSREITVTLQLRARAQWPLASVSVTTANIP
jgi:hypothetical protein